MKSIYEYLDHREFLADYYRHKKHVLPGFSYRYFLAKAGMSSPNFLKNIIDGKRNLSGDGIRKFARALDLPARESHYFALLVKFNQAKSAVQKQVHYRRLSRYLAGSDVRLLQRDQYDYFSHWYNVAVREYLHCRKFKDDFALLARSIRPRISIAQAKKAVALLEQLRLITRGDDGCFKLTDTILSTGPSVASIGAASYHKAMLRVASKAIDTFPHEQRYIHGISGSFSSGTFAKVKTVIDAARKQILELIDADAGKRSVYHVGIQLFPLSSTRKGDSREE